MAISNNCIKLITHYEGLHDSDLSKIGLQPKMDCQGYWTEGWGHAIINPLTKGLIKGKENKELAFKYAKIRNDNNIDDLVEAESLLEEDLLKFITKISKKLKVKLNQSQYDALVSHTFNTGGSDTLFKLINTEPLDSVKIKDWWITTYITSEGEQLPGLVFRRKDEYNLFLTGKLEFSNA